MAGSIVVTITRLAGLTKYSVAWTADVSGNVSANTFDIVYGYILQGGFIPGTGASQPNDGYRVALLDPNGVDLLGGVGIGLSGSNASLLIPALPVWTDGITVTPFIDSADSAAAGPASGVLNVWIAPYPPPMQTITELRAIRATLSQAFGISDVQR